MISIALDIAFCLRGVLAVHHTCAGHIAPIFDIFYTNFTIVVLFLSDCVFKIKDFKDLKIL